ncbi:MAG: HDIG domain-containing protein [Methanomicrobiales archaeon]|nr:HDIG domain-containing protein [Methanomicrobiales archaeon]
MNDPAEDLLRLAGCDEGVILHCRYVRQSAQRYITPLSDTFLVEEGAMLHDIGRARTHAIDHGQAGAEIARNLGICEAVARIIECHIGAGLTADECTLLRLLPRDCMPRTLEEKTVAHADNMVQGNRICILPTAVLSAPYLPRRIRRRMYHLAMEMEECRDRIKVPIPSFR